jgi:hypothetical protein
VEMLLHYPPFLNITVEIRWVQDQTRIIFLNILVAVLNALWDVLRHYLNFQQTLVLILLLLLKWQQLIHVPSVLIKLILRNLHLLNLQNKKQESLFLNYYVVMILDNNKSKKKNKSKKYKRIMKNLLQNKQLFNYWYILYNIIIH